MTKITKPKSPGGGAETREERLKAALKANMARRKAQARARSGAGTGDKQARNEDKG